MGEVTGDRKLHYEGIHNCYSTTNFIRTINKTEMKWVGIQQIWGYENSHILVTKLKQKDQLGDLHTDGSETLHKS